MRIIFAPLALLFCTRTAAASTNTTTAAAPHSSMECYDCGLQSGNDTCGDFAGASKQTCQGSDYCVTISRDPKVDVYQKYLNITRGCDNTDDNFCEERGIGCHGSIVYIDSNTFIANGAEICCCKTPL